MFPDNSLDVDNLSIVKFLGRKQCAFSHQAMQFYHLQQVIISCSGELSCTILSFSMQ